MADKLKTAFIGSVDEQGYPNIKAMLQPRKREGIRVFYFTTNTSSMRVRQFLSDSKACVYFCDNRFFRGAMLRGTMEVLTDAESKEMIWRDGDTEYYSEGVTDADYCVLKFMPHPAVFTAIIIRRNLPLTEVRKLAFNVLILSCGVGPAGRDAHDQMRGAHREDEVHYAICRLSG